MNTFEAGLDGITFHSQGSKVLGGLYKGAGVGRRPTAVLLHGLPGVEKNLDIAYGLRDLGWNCLYFHFRGSWGSEGSYSLTGLADDTRAAIDWVLDQPSVDPERLVLIGASTGGYVVLAYAATDPRVRAIVGVCPLIEPRAFELGDGMANEFAEMLHGISARALQQQWLELPSLADAIPSLGTRPLLVVTGDKDDLFPPSHYTDFLTRLPHARWARAEDGDHAFSRCRSWLPRTVIDWLDAEVGSGPARDASTPRELV